MKRVTIHSDGGCKGNPGPGGWAVVLTYGAHTRELSGGCASTTNNRMELQAAIEGLRALKTSCEVEFYTDSQYLRNGISSWVHGWKRNGWLTATKQPVKNADLWKTLSELAAKHRVNWHWVKAHAGHKANERCDELAGKEIRKWKKNRQEPGKALASEAARPIASATSGPQVQSPPLRVTQ